MHYIPNKLYFINQFNFSENNERSEFSRKKRKFNSRNNLLEVQNQIIGFNGSYRTYNESRTFENLEFSIEHNSASEINSQVLPENQKENEKMNVLGEKEQEENEINVNFYLNL